MTTFFCQSLLLLSDYFLLFLCRLMCAVILKNYCALIKFHAQ
uniref:Uncharacterized protein n=1 Tax=Anguilla anguilla TaxID=7936 RepID=A0A0E9VVH4_ANGAN